MSETLTFQYSELFSNSALMDLKENLRIEALIKQPYTVGKNKSLRLKRS